MNSRSLAPGTRLIWAGVALLAVLAGVAFYVSFEAQYGFAWSVKHLSDVSFAEALIPDAGMLICALLALAMAVQGRSAKAARLLVVGFAALSAVMNYEAADALSPRSVTVYVMPAIAFAVCTDLAVAVVRRFYYGVEEASPWAAAGRLARTAVLYALRFALAPWSTGKGLRQVVLDAAPLPDSSETPGPVAVAADPVKPPPVPAATAVREPEHPPSEARVTGLAAAPGMPRGSKLLDPGTEWDMIQEVKAAMGLGYEPPTRNGLARDKRLPGSEATRRRYASHILKAAKAELGSPDDSARSPG